MTYIQFVESLGSLGLFLANVLAASILPFPYEAAMLFSLTFLDPFAVVLISLVGGMVGAIVNYYIGIKGVHVFLVRRSPKKEKQGQKWFKRWGPVVLLVAPWIPFFGDPLTIVAGALQMDFRKFLAFTIIGKAIKMLSVVYLGIYVLALL